MKSVLLSIFAIIFLISPVAHDGVSTYLMNDHNFKPTGQSIIATETSNQSDDSSSNTTNQVKSILLVFIIIAIIISVLIIAGIALGVTAYMCKNKYFLQAGPDERLKSIKFYINKHTIFRRFALVYSIIHYTLSIFSTVTTLATIYMVVDTPKAVEIQIVVLLLAAIFSSLNIILRFDKVGGCYAQAMRVLEKAILTYLADPNESLKPLVDANAKAEEIIEHNFF